MNKNLKHWKMILPMAALMVLVGAAGAMAQCAPKVDNFYIFVDQSGSMYMNFIKTNTTKVAAAKQVIAKLDKEIPELGYKGGMGLFAPLEEVLPLTVYKRGMLESALGGIKDQQKIFGRETPMKTGILELEQKAILENVTGPTTVIMLTDGAATPGEEPLAAVKQLVETYPRVAFHVISFAEPTAKDPKLIKQSKEARAQEKKAEETNKMIAQLGHGIFVPAADLIDNPATVRRFAENVFCAREKIILRGVQFDFDKADIKPEYEPILDEAVSQLKKWVWPDYKLVISGHTDSVGKPDYNQKLSERRAMAVMKYFASKGIPAAKMKAMGYGQKMPIADNKTDAGRALNRRVELDVLQ